MLVVAGALFALLFHTEGLSHSLSSLVLCFSLFSAAYSVYCHYRRVVFQR